MKYHLNKHRKDVAYLAFTRHEKEGVIYYTSPLFDKLGIPHFFASRIGGVSEGDFGSLNISTSRKNSDGKADSMQNVRENLRRGLSLIGKTELSACMMKQVHDVNVISAFPVCSQYFDGVSECEACDGIFCSHGDPIDTLCVKTADCVPILLYDLTHDVACALHAGWRGTVNGICGCAVRTLRAIYGQGEIVCAIGPCIHECCYEVDDKVLKAAIDGAEASGIPRNIAENCFPQRYTVDGQNKYRVSLPALNKMFLQAEGVREENISVCELCTCCAEDENGKIFFSHRASGGFSGTQMSVVALK